MRIIPAIDLIGGKTVRLKQGKYDKKIDYSISPVDAALKWEVAGAELIHVVDLDGAKEGRPVNLSIVAEIAQTVDIPVEVGGGFREIDDIRKALKKGIYRVVVGSRVLEDVGFARECIRNFDGKVIFSIDVKDGSPSIRGWKKTVDIDFFTILRGFIDLGVKEIIYTDIKSDGMLVGPDTSGLDKILKEVDIKIISAGGIKTIDHIIELKKLEKKGVSGVIVGRALYEGTIDLKEAINAGKADNPVS